MHSVPSLPAAILFFAAASFGLSATAPSDPALLKARNQQNLQAIDAIIAHDKQSANTPDGQYTLALAYSYAAEVAMELHDKKKAESYAVTGLDIAKKAVDANGSNAEYHRLLGAMCGQVIPSNPLLGALKYGACARDEIEKAISLDPKLALAYVSRGVGNYYLPEQMGGGVQLALKDIDKAIALDPKLADAWLWKGVVLRKANRNAEARQAFTQALKLAPDRAWAKQQLDKTPA
ncbi:MAG TPA: tetratricopeptide repeat protein [Bryobacteraceae bacterium]|jgi:tetratricopeptide (TPR) repeat protein